MRPAAASAQPVAGLLIEELIFHFHSRRDDTDGDQPPKGVEYTDHCAGFVPVRREYRFMNG